MEVDMTSMTDNPQRLDKAGAEALPTPNLPLLRKKRVLGMTERFWEQVRCTPTGCLEWAGRTTRGGYGLFRDDTGKQALIHRFMYRIFVGKLPDTATLDHLCRNRRCFNPDHLEGASQRINILRSSGVAAQNLVKTHCPHGHEFTPENTYLVKRGTSRRCKQCALDAQRRRRGLVGA